MSGKYGEICNCKQNAKKKKKKKKEKRKPFKDEIGPCV